jgi:hypothetical protein
LIDCLGETSLSAGTTSIQLPDLSDLSSDSNESDTRAKVLESKNNPFVSKNGKSNIQGSVVTIILSQSNGSEIPVQNTTRPISIRLTRPENKRPPFERYEVQGNQFRYHKVKSFIVSIEKH